MTILLDSSLLFICRKREGLPPLRLTRWSAPVTPLQHCMEQLPASCRQSRPIESKLTEVTRGIAALR